MRAFYFSTVHLNGVIQLEILDVPKRDINSIFQIEL